MMPMRSSIINLPCSIISLPSLFLAPPSMILAPRPPLTHAHAMRRMLRGSKGGGLCKTLLWRCNVKRKRRRERHAPTHPPSHPRSKTQLHTHTPTLTPTHFRTRPGREKGGGVGGETRRLWVCLLWSRCFHTHPPPTPPPPPTVGEGDEEALAAEEGAP